MQLSFSSVSNSLDKETQEYRDIWLEYGDAILAAFTTVTGLEFTEDNMKIEVYEGVSNSGQKGTPMKLRASYDKDVKLGTLIHELGHRLLFQIENRSSLDEHQILFLFLYDVWEKVKGKEFADGMVGVEKQRKGIYDYEKTWDWTLSKSSEERKLLWREILSSNWLSK